MTEAFEIVVVVSAALATLGVLPRAHRWIWPHRADSDVRMTWVAALIVAVAGALTTHLLATKRDRDRERNAQVERTAHYAQLRPLLRHDAEQFGIAIQELSKRGHIAPIDTTHPGELIHDDMFSGQTLVSDFPAHFPAYASERDTVEKLVIGHEIALRSLRDRVADVVKWQPDPNAQRMDVAYGLVRRCMGSAGSYELLATPGGGYQFNDGATGGGSNGTGTPPVDLIARVKAFNEFRADESFNSACDALKQEATDLTARLSQLASQATDLAEMSTVSGDCKYLH